MTASEDERADATRAESLPPAWPQVSDADPRPVIGNEHNGDGSSAPEAATELEGAAANGTKPTEDAEPTDDADDSAGGRKAKKPAKKGSFWKELPILVVIALVLTFLIQTFLARVYVIPSGSMEQTLHGCPGCTGDRILVDKVTYDFGEPSPGNVIVFRGPPGWAQSEFNVNESSNPVIRWLRQFGSSIGIGSPPEYDLVKRVIAVGGQTVACCDEHNRVLVDGKPLNEPYIYWEPGFPQRQQSFTPVKVPKGDLWVMGDNRNNSDDSRLQNGGGVRGVVPVDNVIGIARTIIWPPARWRGIGEIDPHAQAVALGAPAMPGTVPAVPAGEVPLGVGIVAAWPVRAVGRRGVRSLRRRLRMARGRR